MPEDVGAEWLSAPKAAELPGLGVRTVHELITSGEMKADVVLPYPARSRAAVPLILLLDEPTASLDAATEHALFERFAGQARRAADRAGTVTLLVSHRFSTVRMADVILVVEGGRIVEKGDHEALMALGGRYAELYGLQARSYR